MGVVVSSYINVRLLAVNMCTIMCVSVGVCFLFFIFFNIFIVNIIMFYYFILF